jgi:glycosyltransferase involved in cell wall biosynthesis
MKKAAERDNVPGELNRKKWLGTISSRIKTMIDSGNANEFKKWFPRLIRKVSKRHGLSTGLNLIKKIEVSAGLRKPSLALYDNCLHFIGGGQKYGMTMALALQDIFDITILSNQPVNHQNILDWYDLDLSRCTFKIIPIPFYDKSGSLHLDPALVESKTQNPFHLISLESAKYDFFLNNTMLEMVYPLSNLSVMMVHFPERRPRYYFYPDVYTAIMYNSKYTASWIKKKWKLEPHQLKINIPADELKSLYRDAKIFWHLCGLGQNDPAKIEHFGMTICESMQNSLVPIVFDGGGQREIVEHEINGFRVKSTFQLIQYTTQLMHDPIKLTTMGNAARLSSKAYDKTRFIKEVKAFFNSLLNQYISD